MFERVQIWHRNPKRRCLKALNLALAAPGLLSKAATKPAVWQQKDASHFDRRAHLVFFEHILTGVTSFLAIAEDGCWEKLLRMVGDDGC